MVVDIVCGTAQLMRSQPALVSARAGSGRVLSEQMNGEQMRERVGAEIACEVSVVEFVQQRAADEVDACIFCSDTRREYPIIGANIATVCCYPMHERRVQVDV